MKQQPRYQKGDRIGGRYQVHQVLMGGMGEVYLCLDLEENYPIALKTFQQRYQSQALQQAFEAEVATWVALEKHANIVRCFYLRTYDNQPFMALEWVAQEKNKGNDLRSWLRHGPLNLKISLEIAIDICRGLAHGVKKQPGLVHRDLKPENILIAQGGQAKITDFGLAQTVLGSGLAMIGVRQQMTDLTCDQPMSAFIGSGGIAGTPPYMPPEQWQPGARLDIRTDIYAFGCVLYEMLVGHSPFQIEFNPNTADSHQRWLNDWKSAHEDPTPIVISAHIPDPLTNLLITCLSPDRWARPQEVTSLLQTLLHLYEQIIGQPPPPASPPAEFTAIDYNNRGNTYHILGQYEAALTDYDQAIHLNPQSAVAYYNRGNSYYILGQYEAALADYEQTLCLNPHDAETYYNRGLTFYTSGQYEAALADFDQALRLNPNDADTYQNRGITYKTLGQYEAALTDYNQALCICPLDPKGYYNRALTYVAMSQYKAALVDYDQALRLNNQYIDAYINRGSTYDILGQYEAALADFDHAIQLKSHDPKGYCHRGLTYANLGQYKAALSDFDHAIQLKSHDPKTYYNRALTYVAMSQYEAALVDYDQALRLNNQYIDAYINRGSIYDILGQYEAALADFDHAIQLNSKEPKTYYNRGIIYAKLRQYEAALADFDDAIHLNTNYSDAYYNRGLAYFTLGQYEAALADYNQTLRLNPLDSDAYNNRGLTFDNLGQYESALTDYDQALRLNPQNSLVFLNKGVLLAKQGQLREALPYFDKATALGELTGAKYAAQARKTLSETPKSSASPVQKAFDAFQQAGSLTTMGYAVATYPLMIDKEFVAAVEQFITSQVPPEHHPVFWQRLDWLRQITQENNQ